MKKTKRVVGLKKERKEKKSQRYGDVSKLLFLGIYFIK